MNFKIITNFKLRYLPREVSRIELSSLFVGKRQTDPGSKFHFRKYPFRFNKDLTVFYNILITETIIVKTISDI